MATLFISDLHLEAARPEIGEQFLDFLDEEAADADALYILGDFFEYWVGDDDPDAYYASIKQSLRAFTDSGVPVYFMHGNRDFMIGDRFAAETGVTILPDPHRSEFYGKPVLLSHGDALCTDDTEYQQMRAMTRNPDWQAMMLEKPVEERIAIAKQARAQSQERNKTLSESIMDVNPDAVRQIIAEHDVEILLHGHTHRPAIHGVDVDDRFAKRVVLGDWYDQGSVVRWDEDGLELSAIPRQAGPSESESGNQAP
ncbi:MAG TPA: UDP-2,3-diacylglucosamine diphosphatase [Woeseiaceae bacterium]|nr:UDP-2,3-diacylglucosamine diphosphatase [Woeseiaceae bacterium]